MVDAYGRNINYLRIYATEECNLRCKFCNSTGWKENTTGYQENEPLTDDQIWEVCRAAVEAGIHNFRFIGGEPLLRKGLPQLIGRVKGIYGVNKVGITCNGNFLLKFADELAANHLDTVNVTLDTLRQDRYIELTGEDMLQETLDGIQAVLDRGIAVHINAVIQKGLNVDEIGDLVELARDRNIDVRFVEAMPVGRGQNVRVISNARILEELLKRYPDATTDFQIHGSGPAKYVKIPGFCGSIGFISTIHGKDFCSQCNRIRLSYYGQLIPCLSMKESEDLVPILNMPEGNFRRHMLNEALKYAVARKPQRHHFSEKDYIKSDAD